MAQVKLYEQNSYVDELKNEISAADPGSHAARLLQGEVTRLEQGGVKEKDKNQPWINVHPNNAQTVGIRVCIPVKEYPKFNFVGKLLGPKGNSLKRLQDETGTKMSILGRGSMRDRQKEEELRKEGGKYAHLNDELHVLVEAYAEITDAYQRIAHALGELKKFMTPEDFNDEIRQAQLQELMYMNGDKSARGSRGGFRGAPRGRGAGAPPHSVPPVPAPPPPPRGALGRGASGRGASSRGAPTGRGAPSRGAPPGRGAPRGRSAAPPPPSSQAYDDYGSSSYDEYGESGYGDQSYEQGYGSAEHGRGYEEHGRYDDQRYRQDSSYYDYGHGNTSSGYDDYGDGGWGAPSSGGPVKPAASRGGSKGQYRSHPYGGSRGGY